MASIADEQHALVGVGDGAADEQLHVLRQCGVQGGPEDTAGRGRERVCVYVYVRVCVCMCVYVCVCV